MRAVLALTSEDYKRHSGVIARFLEQYLKIKLLPPELSKTISMAFIIRNRSDYEDFYVCSIADTEKLVSLREVGLGVVLTVPLEEPGLAIDLILVAFGIYEDGGAGSLPSRAARNDELLDTIIVQVDFTTAGIVVGQGLIHTADGNGLGTESCSQAGSHEKSKNLFHKTLFKGLIIGVKGLRF